MPPSERGAVRLAESVDGSICLYVNGELFKSFDDHGTPKIADWINAAFAKELKAERERALEERFRFIRCQGPDDILVIPDDADPDAYSRAKNPCHHHAIMREAEFRSLKGPAERPS